ncbi:MAG: ATP-binding protein [Leptospirales bacterium]
MTIHTLLPPFWVALTLLTIGVTYVVRRGSPSTYGLLILPSSALIPGAIDLAALRVNDPELLRELYQWGLAGEFLSGAALLVFAFSYARKNPGIHRLFPGGRGQSIPILIGIVLAVGVSLFTPDLVRVVPISQSATVLFLGGTTATLLSFFLCTILLFGLYQMVRTYHVATGMERWNIKYPLIGVGLWTISVLVVYANQIFDRGFDRSFLLLEGVGLVLMDLFFLYAFLIQKVQEVCLALSRTVINRSLLLLVIGTGLIGLGGLAATLTGLGPIWSTLSGSLMILLGVSIFLVVFSSERLRREMEDFLGVHMYANRYDYREAWMTLTRALGESKSLTELIPRLLEQTREITFAQAIVYCRVTTTSPVTIIPQQASGWKLPRLTGESSLLDESFSRFLSGGVPLHISEIAQSFPDVAVRSSGEALFRHLNATWILPLVVGSGLIGLLGLRTRSAGDGALLEDRLFLQALSVQWGSLLSNASLSRELAWSRESDLLCGLKAFAFHDLKNSGIALKLLLHNAARHIDSPEFQAELLSGLQNVSEQIGATVEQFLSPFNQEFTHQTDFDPNALIRSTLRELGWGKLPDLRTELDLEVVPPVHGNPKTFQSSLRNLLINAREAMEDRGVIRIGSRIEAGKGVLVAVVDNGPGMSQDFIETRLFRPFQTTKRKGSGLGLFSVKLLIEQMGGAIDVYSEEGVGTRFQIFFPEIPIEVREQESSETKSALPAQEQGGRARQGFPASRQNA